MMMLKRRSTLTLSSYKYVCVVNLCFIFAYHNRHISLIGFRLALVLCLNTRLFCVAVTVADAS